MPTVTKAASAHTIVTTGWTNPSNAFATTGDNTYATGTPGKNSTVSGDFGFANFTSADIPDGATINSVTLTVEWGMTAAVTGGTLGVQLRNNGVAQGSETTQTSTTEAQATQVTTTTTLADLRSASTLLKARVRVAQGNTASAMTGNLDFVSMTVNYTLPCPDDNGDHWFLGMPSVMAPIVGAAMLIASQTASAVQTTLANGAGQDDVVPTASVSGSGSVTRETWGVRYQYSGTADEIPQPPAAGPPSEDYDWPARPIWPVVFIAPSYPQADELPVFVNPSIGGGVTKQTWGVRYQYSGTADERPIPAVPFATEDYAWPPSPIWPHRPPAIVSSVSDDFPPATPLGIDESPPYVAPPPDHISTTFPLPWSWESQDDFAPLTQIISEDYAWPPSPIWPFVGPPQVWQVADDLAWLPAGNDDGGGQWPRPWAVTYRTVPAWVYAAGTDERLPFVQPVFEEDSWLLTPGLAPRWCWEIANRYARLVGGWDDGVGPGSTTSRGGTKVVDIAGPITSVDCATSHRSVDLTASERSADLTRVVKSVDIDDD